MLYIKVCIFATNFLVSLKYSFMYRAIIVLSLLIAAWGGVCAQPKRNGRVPVREKRGFDQRITVDTASIRILYALNATDINDENTYIDLGKLEAGKNVKKYSSEFLNLSDQKAVEWKRTHTDRAPKSFWMGGQKEHQEHWSELVFSDYIIRDNKLTEYASMPFLAERDNGRYTEDWPMMDWTLTDETQEILGHNCQKATCRFRGRDFVAWFASDIPVQGGPWKFGGLPGCILKVYDGDNLYVWEAVAIESGKFPISQYPDSFFPKTDRNRIYKLQKRYNENYWVAIGWTSDDGTTPGKSTFQPLELE